MWLKREDYERLVTQAAQCQFMETALAAAEKRAEDAENALASERSAKDWLTLQLSSRVITKHGGYGLEHEPKPAPVFHPQGYTHDPTEIDLAKLEFYKRCARDAGRDEEDAVMRWEAEMRGEGLPIELEAEQ